MADAITIKALQDASLDAKSLEEVVNGDDARQVTTRLGENYPSVKKAIKTLFENGGLPAEPFETKAKMDTDGVSLPDGQYAMVTDDTANNGFYVKTSGAWVRSGYDPMPKVEELKSMLEAMPPEAIIPSYALVDGHYTIDAFVQTWRLGYQRSNPVLLKAGSTLTFDCYGANISALIKTDANLTTGQPLVVIPAESDEALVKKVSYKAVNDTYVAISSKTSVGELNVLVTLSAIMSIDEKINDIRGYITPPKNIDVASEAGGLTWAYSYTVEAPSSVTSKEIALIKGDVLTFEYTPFEGTNLWLWNESDNPADANKGMALLSSAGAGDVKLFTHTAKRNSTVRLVNSVEGTILVNGGVPIEMIDIGSWALRQTAEKEAFTGMKRSLPFDVKKGNVVVVTEAQAGTVAIARKSSGSADYLSLIGVSLKEPKPTVVEWVADKDSTLIISGLLNSEFLIKHNNNESLIDYINKNIVVEPTVDDFAVPSNIVLPDKEFVFATAMNYILKTEVIEGVDYIKISQDLGKTWTQIPNILEDIVSYHFFSDGTIMLCSPQKVYWTDDYLTLNEATVYDHDGSVFVPTNRHFFCMQTGDKIDFVGDTEIYSWGDYHLSDMATRIWYTTDNGRTIKCAAKFGTTNMSGAVKNIRHIHRVYYHQKTDYWYVTTGDAGDECMIIRGRYSVVGDTWAWEVLNSGIDYKFGNIMIDDDNIAFMITDYTEASQAEKKGVYRVHASNLGDFSKYRMIYKAEPSEWGSIAPVSLLLSPNGNKVILPDWLGSGFIWLASDGLDFKKVTVSPNVLLAYTIGENYNGDVWCVAYENSANLRLNSGSYNLTKALRDNGLTDFMRGSTLITGLKTVVS